MAVRCPRRILQKFKPFLKITLLSVAVIFILYKLFDHKVTHTEVIPSGSDLAEENRSFKQPKARQSEKQSILSRTNPSRPNSNFSNSKLNQLWNWTESMLLTLTDPVFVLIPFSNARRNGKLQEKFRTCVTTMSELSSAHIVLFVAGDVESRGLADDVVKSLDKKNVQIHHVDVEELGRMMEATITTLQRHFSYSPGSYYSHVLFFLSTAIHRLAPPSLPPLLMLDADLQFRDDIRHLYDLFHQFQPSNVMGLAYENQPVYRHVLAMYRRSHPGTRAGEPPPDGLPGFNSGVILLDLERMRASERYNKLLDTDTVQRLAENYSYKGHLGDQDFYSLVALENEDLFFVLPCGWNRQLCVWWRDHGYKDVFEQYFACPGRISIYHGNCDTPFPKD